VALPLFLALLAASLFGGFRSSLILSVVFFIFQLYFERLFTARNVAIVAGLLGTFAGVTGELRNQITRARSEGRILSSSFS